MGRSNNIKMTFGHYWDNKLRYIGPVGDGTHYLWDTKKQKLTIKKCDQITN